MSYNQKNRDEHIFRYDIGGRCKPVFSGFCCAVIDGEFYRRYDAKNGKKIPEGAIPCEENPDPVTGHLPCWVKCDRENPADKWYYAAYENYRETTALPVDGTYEAVGPHFQSNPYGLEADTLIPHGKDIIEVNRSYEGIRDYLESHWIEGIVLLPAKDAHSE